MGRKSCARTLQLLPVSPCGKDIEIFAIASFQSLAVKCAAAIILFTLGFCKCVFQC